MRRKSGGVGAALHLLLLHLLLHPRSSPTCVVHCILTIFASLPSTDMHNVDANILAAQDVNQIACWRPVR